MPRQKKSSREMIEAGQSPHDDNGRYAGGRGGYYDEVLRATYGDNDDAYLLEHLADGVNRDRILKFDPNVDVIEQACELLRTQQTARAPRKASSPRRRKTSEQISEQQFRMAYSAIKLCSASGTVFNAFICFALDGTVNETGFNKHFDRWLASLADWCRRRAIQLRYVYSLENPPDKYLHAHVLLHIPGVHMEEFITWCWRSLRAIAPSFYRMKSNAVQRSYDDRRQDQWQWFLYMMKGLDPYAGWRRGKPRPKRCDFACRLGMPKKWLSRPQGTIQSKRVGISSALSFRKYGIDDLLGDVTQRTPDEIWEKHL